MGGDNGDVVGSQIAHEVSIGAEDGMRSHSSFILVYLYISIGTSLGHV